MVLREFEVFEVSDKAAQLDDDRLGFKSVHLLVRLAPRRLSLPEYSRYNDLVCELQIRTVLQHAGRKLSTTSNTRQRALFPRRSGRDSLHWRVY